MIVIDKKIPEFLRGYPLDSEVLMIKFVIYADEGSVEPMFFKRITKALEADWMELFKFNGKLVAINYDYIGGKP